MAQHLKVLIIEKTEDEARKIALVLEHGNFGPRWLYAGTMKDMNKALETEMVDLVISADRLARFTGIDAVVHLRKKGFDIPIVIVAEKDEAEPAVEALKAGADDFIPQKNIRRLPASVERVLSDRAERKHEADPTGREDSYRNIVDDSPLGFAVILGNQVVLVNKALERISGYSRDELLAFTQEEIRNVVHPDDREYVWRGMQDRLAGKSVPEEKSFRFIRKDGEIRWVEVTATLVEHQDAPAVQVTYLDITDRKRAEQALQYSEKKYRQVIENAAELIFTTDINGNFTFANPAALKACGYTTAELTRYNYLDLIPESHRKKTQIFYMRQFLKREKSTNHEYPIRMKSGEIGWFSQNATLMYEQGHIAGFHLVGRDITKSKQAEEALQESEKRYREFINATDDLVFIKDETFRYLAVNRANQAFFGKSEHEIIGKTDFDLMPKDAAAACRRSDQRALKENRIVVDYETMGDRIYETRKFPIPLGTASGVGGFIRDITDSKQAQQKLKESEEKYRNLFENAKDVNVTFDLKGNVTSVNRAVEEYGFKRNEIIGKNVTRFASKQYWPQLFKDIADLTRGKATEGEIVLKTPVGEKNVAFSSNPIKEGNRVVGIQSIMRDITRNKEAEEALKASESRMKSIINHSNELFFIHDTQHNLTYCSPQSKKIMGYTPDEMRMKWTSLTTENPINEQGFLLTEKAVKTGKRQKPYILEVTRKDGKNRFVEVDESPLKDEKGSVVGLTGAVRDVTAKHEAEEALKDSEERYRALVEKSGVAILIDDEQGQFSYFNQRFYKLFGYTRKEMQSKSIQTLVHPDDLPRVIDHHKSRFQGRKSPTRYEFRGVRKNGAVIHLEVDSIPVLRDGRIEGTRSYLWDITDRKHDEDAVIETKEKLEAIFESAGDGIIYMDKQGTILEANPKFFSITGLTRNQLIGKSAFVLAKSFLRQAELAKVLPRIKDALIGKSIDHYEVNYQDKILEVSAPRKKDSPGITGVVRDVTARRRAEEQIRMLGASVENATDGIVITDLKGRIVYVNKAINHLYGHAEKQLIQKPVFVLNASRDDTEMIRLDIEKTGQWNGEVQQRRKDGSTFPGSLTLFTIPNTQGQPQYIVAFISDITQQKAASEKIKASLHEKDILLKEIHHRVKNNLQIIISLLNLQAGRIEEEAALHILEDSKRRIYAMALVHEKLYRSGDFANIDFRDYIQSMARDLIQSYGVSDRVMLDTRIKSIPLSIDKAIPCGLIVNELITNAVKHAFPERPGTIALSFGKDPEGNCRLIVKDDGVGLPPGFDIEKSQSLGLQLVTILSEQIDGTLSIQRRNGTTFRITFPVM